ncbi:MAG: UvrD-helicase domain-containing protein [Chloroflexi bacterium]|nr:UvrD-helicase domain-containing protein [Chloroflexota bacterium]
MAQIIPATPIQGSPPETIRLFHLLKRLPDGIVIIQRLPALHGPGPDFLLLQANQALFLAISITTPQEAIRARQMGLFGGDVRPLGEEEQERLAVFSHSGAIDSQLPAAILFPNLNQKQMGEWPALSASIWVSKETLVPGRFTDWLDNHLSAPLTDGQIGRIRQQFTPEVIVPTAFTVRQPIERHTEAELGRYLLDYDQEQALKLDLDLPQSEQTTARDFQLRLINGVAGSGKSLIVIYRAHILRQLFPHKRILVLTHNRALIHDLRRRYDHLADGHLSEGGGAVQMYTFMGWCRRHWPQTEQWRKLISYRERLELATQIGHEQLRDTAVSEQMLLEEIDWYKDRLLFSRDDYLAADRAGRGFALNQPMRQRLFDAMTVYHDRLQQRRLMDWGDVPRQLWRLWHDGEALLPRYDIILVDEAQFFAPLWFEIIKRILTPDTGHLFLVADASQGFLKRGQSWLSSGLNVRGRVHRLHKSYRTTREILDFATLLYRTRLPEDDADIVAPDLTQMPNGVVPVVIPLTSPQDELTRVVNEIGQLAQGGVPWRDILIIHASREEIRPILLRLNGMFGAGTACTERRPGSLVEVAVDPGQTNPQNQIRVCSLNAATGLESPIVFLMGAHELYEREQSIRLSDEERVELIRDNTRKLYMAITRAGQRLVITYVGALPDILKL